MTVDPKYPGKIVHDPTWIPSPKTRETTSDKLNRIIEAVEKTV